MALPRPDVVTQIARCVDALEEPDRLRTEVDALRRTLDPRAQFAAALLDLERAKRGDPEARLGMLDVADTLLVYWHEGTGAQLSTAHPALAKLWTEAEALLRSFQGKRFEKALKACWDAREDAGALAAAVGELTPDDDRRVEFARCLYHLELARKGVTASRVEFARRAGLLSDAYRDEEVAKELVGGDSGLEHLWRELHPYLDEFFETMELEAAKRARASATTGQPPTLQRDFVATQPNVPAISMADVEALRSTQPGTPMPEEVLAALHSSPTRPDLPAQTSSPSGEFLASTPSSEYEVLEVVESPPAPPLDTTPPGSWRPPANQPPAAPPPPPIDLTPPGSWMAPPGLRDGAPPAPPVDLTPPGAWFPPVEPSGDDIDIVEAVEAPPPPPAMTPAAGIPAVGGGSLDVSLEDDYVPTAAAQHFWAHTFKSLNLMPDPRAPRAIMRLLAVESREDRRRLTGYIDSLGPYAEVPEARAFSCLLKLMMAGQLKEKSLFGQANPRRAEAFADAFALLSGDTLAAGHAGVWFVMDGTETLDALQRGLEGLVEYLAFCGREQVDPLSEGARAAWRAAAT